MVIFDERGVRIFLRDGKYFMESDMGHFAEEYVEIEISKEDAEKVMEDVMYSSHIALNWRNKKRGLL
ncbi:hypothetical protein [Oscillibacter sp.]|uniref:hypothetical protein n=1 Tax=Oscillibacter sp. TaxID=1945593 RepID=UPI00289F870E|nr:hypothetical protein [Oscillibacter sp.]